MLESNIDNKGNNEPNTLKQAMCYSDWSKQKKTMQVKYNPLIENKIWELTLMLKNQQVIID